jgi:hypothetical protein
MTKNVLFQEQNVGFEYDNEAYKDEDEEDEEEEEILYGHDDHNEGGRRNRDFMEIEDEPFPPQNNFLRIQRQHFDDDCSDTSI